jgi:urease accessory protein
MDNNFLLLQINDALFPIVGYSHSYGLETYIQRDMLKTEAEIRQYLDNRIKYSIKYTELLGARLAYECAEDMQSLRELDEIMTASKAPREIRLASIKLGSRFIKTLNGCELKLNQPYFSEYSALGHTDKHHCIAYGVVCRAAELNLKSALSAYLYAQCSAIITNCVKLVPLSQSVGQRLLYDSFALMEAVVSETLCTDKSKLCLSTPAFDIRCMEHEGLYSRLYMS